MHAKLLSTAAAAATVFLLPLAGQAGSTVYTDNANNSAYSGGYAGQGGSAPGFGAFKVVTAGPSSGTFDFTAAEAEGNSGTPVPATIDTGNKSFGLYAQGADDSVTITRSFKAPLAAVGETFSLDFVTGYNDGGTVGVALTNAGGAVGKFFYQGDGSYYFNGKAAVTGYARGALHLTYTLTSPTTYSFTSTGAVSYSGTGTFSSPITGFEVQQTKSGAITPDHNAYFNNLSLKMSLKKALSMALKPPAGRASF